MEENNNKGKKERDSLSLKALWPLCKVHWKWFVVSVVVAVTLGLLYSLTAQQQYSRRASLLLKEEDGKPKLGGDLGFGDMNLFGGDKNVHNELASIQSKLLVKQVVDRLNLVMDYAEQGRFRSTTLYGKSLPVLVAMTGLKQEDYAAFNMQIAKNGDILLRDFVFNADEFDQEVKGRFNEVIKTPVGPVVISRNPGYVPPQKNPLMTVTNAKPKTEWNINVAHYGLESAVGACNSRLKVSLESDKSTILNLSYTDSNSERAEDFLNTLIDVYNESWVLDNNQVTVSTSKFIDERLAIIERELGNVDSDISSYKSAHMIPDPETTAKAYMERAEVANAQILELNNQLAMARYLKDYIQRDAAHNHVLPVNSGLKSSSIEKQIDDYNALMLQRNNVVTNSGDKNPLVQDLDKSLAPMRRAIVASIDNQISSLNAQIQGYSGSERNSNARIASSPTEAKYLLSVERQQKVKESLYLFLLKKREENELSQAFTAYNTRVVTPPHGNAGPTWPHPKMILAVSFMLGLAFPVVVILIRENFNTKVRGTNDLKTISVPYIGEIPLYKPGRKSGSKSKASDTILVEPKNRNIVNEAFRVVRTNVELMMDDKDHKVIMVSSINPGSGKSFIFMNLAASFAVQGKRTIVVDLDMRKGTINNYVGKHHHGVVDYLNGRSSDLDSLIVNVDSHPNLSVLPVGFLPPNPTELLKKESFHRMIEELRKDYDVVVLDCPPVDVVADSAIITKEADMTIFVVRAGLLERDQLPVIEEYYQSGKFSNMALLLNGTDQYASLYGSTSYGYGKNAGYYANN